jgi:hypothetical protein
LRASRTVGWQTSATHRVFDRDRPPSGAVFAFPAELRRYSDYFERVLWLSQFHRALRDLKRKNPHIEIEEAPERNVQGFKGYRLKQSQLAML